MNRLKAILTGKGSAYAYALTTAVIAIVPESCFTALKTSGDWSDQAVVIVGRLAICAAILAISNIAYACYQKHRKSVSINDGSYSIQVEYGDLFSVEDGKVLVNFDECFTTKVGDRPFDVKPDSVCGQYLMKHPVDDMEELIREAGAMPDEERSLIDGRPRYKPGTIVPNGRYLLMSFAKLSENGRGQLTYDEYLECLNSLWEELDLYHGTKDVYLPILGSRITRFDKELTQQQLLDIIIGSYRLSKNKMGTPCSLHIVCRRRDGFSLDNIFGVS